MHILVATDGSEFSVSAAGRAAELLKAAEHVTLLTVLSEIPGDDAGGFAGSVYTPEEQETVWNQELADAREELERTAKVLSTEKIDKRIEVGDVGGTVCHIAEKLNVDVIVVGSHGRKGFNRLLLGSASEQIVRHAPCPVLVVRHQRKP